MKGAAKLTGAEALLGAGLGAYVAKDYGKKAMLKTAGGFGAVGAGFGSTIGVACAAGGQLGMRAGLKLREKNKDLDKTYKENKKRLLDNMKIAEGKMTKAEYAKKWYKD